MKQSSVKRILGAFAAGLATVLLVTTVVSRHSSAVHAQEVFTKIKEIGNQTSETTPFQILEVVDQKSVWEWSGNTASITTRGEEELGYLIGGQEPFQTIWSPLVEECWAFYYGDDGWTNFRNGTINGYSDYNAAAGIKDVWNTRFASLITVLQNIGKLEPAGTIVSVEPGNTTEKTQYPLNKVEKTTYLPLKGVDPSKYLCLIEKETVTAGYFVPASEETDGYGCYKITPGTGGAAAIIEFVGPLGLGQVQTLTLRQEAPSVSENTVSENDTVSDNDIESEEGEEEGSSSITEESGSQQGTGETTGTPEGAAGGNVTTGTGATTENNPSTGAETPSNGGNSSGNPSQTEGGEPAGTPEGSQTGAEGSTPGTGNAATGTGENTQNNSSTGAEPPSNGGNSSGNSSQTEGGESSGGTPESNQTGPEGSTPGTGREAGTETTDASPLLWRSQKTTVKSPLLSAGTIQEGYYNYYTSLDGLTEEQKNNALSIGPDVNINTFQNPTVYKMTYLGIQNNEWFKHYVFGVGLAGGQDENGNQVFAEDVNITVNTVAASELTVTNLANVDLLYLNADLTISPSGSAQDMSKEAAKKILELILDRDHPIACVVDTDAYTVLNPSGGPMSNTVLNKLLHILYQEEIRDVYLDTIITDAQWESTSILDSATPEWAGVLTGNDAWKTKLGSDTYFVRNNVFFINKLMDTSTPEVELNQSLKDYGNAGAAFEQAWLRIEQENYERTQLNSGAGTVDKMITPATCLQTIISYTPEPAVLQKGSLRILELEPCYDFKYAATNYDTDAKKAQKLKDFKDTFLPLDSSAEVEIIGMTTSEFCGKIEDINVEYDMIYIGSQTGRMNRKETAAGSGKYYTVYNDEAMYGIVYAHTGDLCNLKGEHSGLVLNNENNTYRYSGNDILENQKDTLLNFLKSGAPVVVAEDFFIKNESREIINLNAGDQGDTITIGTETKTRYGILDTSSYLYQFVKEASAGEGASTFDWDNRRYENFVAEHEVGPSAFSKWLNQPKLSVKLMSQPTEYNYTTKVENGASVIADSNYLVPDSNGNYWLSFEFIINNLASLNPLDSSYTVSLWVDANMDGKFSGTTEQLEDLTVENLSQGTTIGANQLKVGTAYRVTRRLPDEFVGAVPWKLMITDNANSNLRGAATGMTAVKAEKQKIKILQLYAERREGDNLQKKMQQNPTGLWATLLNNVPDFEVEMTSIKANYFLAAEISDDHAELAAMGDIDTYDMIIVGFDDAFLFGKQTGNTHQARLSKLIQYAKSGKCVLFSHDNTNWYNGPLQNNTLNMSIRDLTGLDRYGVTIGRGNVGSITSGTNHINQGDVIDRTSKTELEDYLFGNDGLQGYSRDVAYKANTNQAVMVPQTQGITYSGNEHDRITNNWDQYRYLDFTKANEGTWINRGDNRIGKVNAGAITEYPYRLPNTIKVDKTHAQYYQLDLESDSDGDGEGDIVVWYTMDNSDAGTLNDVYDHSPGDVRNNYYIYNRGNITYTGMGHSSINNEEEIKLFINTMIAAYRVSMKSPQVKIVESPGDLTDKMYDAIPYDEIVDNNQTTYRAYFQIWDNNFISDSQKHIYYKIYTADTTGGITISPDTGERVQVADKTNQWKVYEADTAIEVNELQSGHTYHIDIPLTGNLSDTKSIDLYIEIQSEIVKNGKTHISSKVYDNLTISRLQLFDLD